MYYPSSENKGADQLRGYREADLRLCFRLGKNPVFSRCGSNCSVASLVGIKYQSILVYMSRLVGKPTMWFSNRSDTNRPVQAQKRAKSLKFRIKVEEELYEGCFLILVIDLFSPKPSSIPEENYLVVIDRFLIDRFLAILKSPNHFKMIQLIMAN